MRMLRDNVLVQAIATEDKVTEGGIILTQPSEEKKNAPAFVIAIGPDVTLVTPCDQVFVNWSGGTQVEIDGKQAVVLEEKDIMAIVEGVEQ